TDLHLSSLATKGESEGAEFRNALHSFDELLVAILQRFKRIDRRLWQYRMNLSSKLSGIGPDIQYRSDVQILEPVELVFLRRGKLVGTGARPLRTNPPNLEPGSLEYPLGRSSDRPHERASPNKPSQIKMITDTSLLRIRLPAADRQRGVPSF